jgi:hypothetical protein
MSPIQTYSNSYQHIACSCIRYIYIIETLLFSILQNLQSTFYTLLYLKLVGKKS